MSATLKIGELAKRSGSTTKTIRYYELLGLLPEPQRADSGYRLYDDKDVERLVFIRKAKELGFSLTDVAETLAVADSHGEVCIHVLALVDQKIEEIDELVGGLREFQQELRGLREQSASQAGNGAREASLCAIVDRGIHAKGEAALAWLEGRRSTQIGRPE